MAGLFFILWLVGIAVAQLIGQPKKRSGWAWGLLLGWVGVVVVACLPARDTTPASLTAKQQELAELEAEVKMAELRQRQTALIQPTDG
jgi:hypothetical protein